MSFEEALLLVSAYLPRTTIKVLWWSVCRRLRLWYLENHSRASNVYMRVYLGELHVYLRTLATQLIRLLDRASSCGCGQPFDLVIEFPSTGLKIWRWRFRDPPDEEVFFDPSHTERAAVSISFLECFLLEPYKKLIGTARRVSRMVVLSTERVHVRRSCGDPKCGWIGCVFESEQTLPQELVYLLSRIAPPRRTACSARSPVDGIRL